eukprot:TRINITY_DN13132_c0_g1_i1.p2 TRINITY_DN13132_c0_g1~~TRINITY_DN13132_c0_g1_i1.p2  ORF type:complete len:113 (-),score=12.96 TRINITY_DN13132_c0_g1_i1:157-495(-)
MTEKKDSQNEKAKVEPQSKTMKENWEHFTLMVKEDYSMIKGKVSQTCKPTINSISDKYQSVKTSYGNIKKQSKDGLKNMDTYLIEKNQTDGSFYQFFIKRNQRKNQRMGKFS